MLIEVTGKLHPVHGATRQPAVPKRGVRHSISAASIRRLRLDPVLRLEGDTWEVNADLEDDRVLRSEPMAREAATALYDDLLAAVNRG